MDACHARGLAVLLDVVYNHLGPSGNHLGRFAPYFTTRYSSPWGPAINFDGPDSDEVRRFFCDNARMWLRDYHLDGLRLDAVHAIFDTSAEPFLEQLGVEVKQLEAQLNRALVVIAESDSNDPRLLWPRNAAALDSTPNGAMIFTTPSTRFSPENRTATMPTSALWPSWRRPCSRLTFSTGFTPSTAAAGTGARRPDSPGTASWHICKTTIKSVTARRGSAAAS